MAEPFLTRHAVQRYRERVADVPAAAIWQALNCAAVRVAIDFGARYVRLAGGQRVVLDKDHIITILPSDHPPGRLDPLRDSLFDDGEDHAQG